MDEWSEVAVGARSLKWRCTSGSALTDSGGTSVVLADTDRRPNKSATALLIGLARAQKEIQYFSVYLSTYYSLGSLAC